MDVHPGCGHPSLSVRVLFRQAELGATERGEIGLGGAADEIDFEVVGGEVGGVWPERNVGACLAE